MCVCINGLIHSSVFFPCHIFQGQPLLMQCPCNQHHFIDKNSLEKHKLKCRYGVVGVVSDDEEAESGSTFVRIS